MSGNTNKKKVGLALGSGGVRGLAHVGVIKSLAENNIPIDLIAGSSIGSWVGAHYALFQDVELLRDFTVGKKKEKLLSFLDPKLRGGLVGGNKLESMLDLWLNHCNFEDLKIPLAITTTDLISGKQHVFQDGNLAFACRASMAVPGIFRPVKFEQKLLVDGGISDPVPDDLLKQLGADIIISVNLDHRGELNINLQKPKLIDVSIRTMDLLRQNLAKLSMQQSDVIIEPNLSKYAKWSDYFLKKNEDEIVEAGWREANSKIKDILSLLNSD